MYIVIAAVLSLLGRPLFSFFDSLTIGRIKLPPSVSALLVLLVFIGFFAGVISLFIPLIAQEIRIISSIDVNRVLEQFHGPIKNLEEWIQKYQISPEPDFSLTALLKKRLAALIDLGQIPSLFGSVIGKLGGAFVFVFSVLFITFFFLKERNLLNDIVFTVTPPSKANRIRRVLENTKRLLSRYFLGILFQIIMITTVATIGLSILGLDHALIIGFLAGVSNIIPYLGPIIGASFGIFIGLTTNLHLEFYSGMFPLVGKILLVFAVVQMMDNLLFQPIIFSSSTYAHPLEVFLVIMVGATLAGILGMILAMPVYTFIRICAKEFLSEFRIVRDLTKGI